MDTKYQWSSSVESAELDGSWLAVHLERFTVSTFSEVGDFIWSCLRRPMNLQDVVSRLLDEFEVSEEVALIDVATFMNQLVELGVLETVQ